VYSFYLCHSFLSSSASCELSSPTGVALWPPRGSIDLSAYRDPTAQLNSSELRQTPGIDYSRIINRIQLQASSIKAFCFYPLSLSLSLSLSRIPSIREPWLTQDSGAAFPSPSTRTKKQRHQEPTKTPFSFRTHPFYFLILLPVFQ